MHSTTPPRSRLARSPAPEPSPSFDHFITPTTTPLLPAAYIIPSSPSSTGAISHRSDMTAYTLHSSPMIAPTQRQLRFKLESRTPSPSPPQMPRHPLFAMIARQRWDYERMVARAQRRREKQQGVGAEERRRRREEMKGEMEWKGGVEEEWEWRGLDEQERRWSGDAGEESERSGNGRKNKRVVSGAGVEVGRKKRAVREVAIGMGEEVKMGGVGQKGKREGTVGGDSGNVVVA